MFERILVPLDGSERGESVLARVATLLRKSDSEVVLLRVVEFPTTLRTYDPRLLTEARAEAKRYLAEVAQRLIDQGAQARFVIAEGLAADAIVAAAREQKAGLVAMTTHGRSGIARFVLGSVTEKVVRGCQVPVLVIHSFESAGGPAKPDEQPFRKILVPLDGSDTSMAVLAPVAELAKVYGSDVLLLHVDEGVLYPPGSFAGGMGGVPVPPPVMQPPPDPAELLRPALQRLAPLGVSVQVLVATGDPASRILESADRHAVDLVAMATHGRSGISRWVLGSVTEKVVRSSTIPLLVVRNAPQAKAKAG